MCGKMMGFDSVIPKAHLPLIYLNRELLWEKQWNPIAANSVLCSHQSRTTKKLSQVKPIAAKAIVFCVK